MLREVAPRKPDARVDSSQLAAWLNATACGDEKAFQRLYETTSPRLYALLRNMLKTEADAQDALQDTFFKIWQKAGSYSSERGAAQPWLISIARHRALDQLRQTRFEVALPDDPELADRLMVDRARRRPDNEQETLESLKTLLTGLAMLQDNHKRALLLAYYYGLTHQELACKLDAPIGTVKSWVRRGLTHLIGLSRTA